MVEEASKSVDVGGELDDLLGQVAAQYGEEAADEMAKQMAGQSGGLPASLDVSQFTCCMDAQCPSSMYNTQLSGGNFKPSNKSMEMIEYGSGKTYVKTGTDHMAIGTNAPNKDYVTIAQPDVPVRMIVHHEVAVFQHSKMSTILGVGPGLFERRHKRFNTHLGIGRFTICLQDNADAIGLWTWHDRSRKGEAGWIDVPVPAKIYWAVAASNFRLGGDTFGCNDPSCGAVIDTGTSLITPPTAAVEQLGKLLQHKLAGSIK